MKKGFADTPGGQMFYLTEGSGYPVVFFHQSNFSSGEFVKVIPLVAKEFQVFAPDTLGYGYSDPAPLHWEFKDWINVLPAFMDAVGIKKAHVVGHHTGSLLAAALAAYYPERVNKLILNGCVLPEPEQAKKFYEQQKSEPPIGPLKLERDGSHAIRMWKWQLRENPESPDEAVLYATIANWEHYFKQGGDIFNRYFSYDLGQDLPKIKAETLCLMGTKEQFNPNQPGFLDPATAANAIPGAKARAVEGAGILFWYDIPEVGAKIVLDFLKDSRV